MKFRQEGNLIILRLDRGEEILGTIMAICRSLNVSCGKDGECYLHIHVTLGDDKGYAFGGHLNAAIISVTAEIFIQTFPLEVGRKVDEAIGLNVLAL